MSLMWLLAGGVALTLLGMLALLVLVSLPVKVAAGMFPYRVSLRRGLPWQLVRWTSRIAPLAALAFVLWLVVAFLVYGTRLSP